MWCELVTSVSLPFFGRKYVNCIIISTCLFTKIWLMLYAIIYQSATETNCKREKLHSKKEKNC